MRQLEKPELVIRINWQKFGGNSTGTKEISIQLEEKDLVHRLREIVVQHARDRVRRFLAELFGKDLFVNGRFSNPKIVTVEMLIVTHKDVESIDGLDLRQVFNQSLVSQLEIQTHLKE